MRHVPRLVTLALGVALAAAPATAPRSPAPEFDPGWKIELASWKERGRRLVLDGVVRRRADGDSVPGLLLYAYQTDSRGRYGTGRADDETNPRLSGYLRTGPHGEFRIRTILPGDYGGGPSHIHFLYREPLGGTRMTFINLFPPLDGVYPDYRPFFPRGIREPRPGFSKDVAVAPDSAGTFRVSWELRLADAVDAPARPGWPEP